MPVHMTQEAYIQSTAPQYEETYQSLTKQTPYYCILHLLDSLLPDLPLQLKHNENEILCIRHLLEAHAKPTIITELIQYALVG